MKTRTLNGTWTLEIPGTPFAAVPATVPGSVYHDLLAAERIPDPFYRDNEMETLKLMDNDFVYFRSFQVDDALLAGDKVLLRAEGLDTIAAVHINGQIVGEACNMHRIWEFDVKSVLHPGENTITVSFRSPTKYIKEAYAKSVADGSSDAMVGFPNIRKAHCMFGWDWGPRLPDAGIWRNISIISIEKARIQDVRVDQFHKDGTVRLRIHTNLNRYTDDEVWVNVSVTAPDGSVLTASGTDCELIVQNPADSYLQRQQTLLSAAHISTVHSFCLELVRANFQLLDIPADFRLGSENEIKLLEEDIAQQTIEQNYENNDGRFSDLVELVSSGRDDKGLQDTLHRLYGFVRSHPFYRGWLDEKLLMYDDTIPVGETVWGKVILQYAMDALRYAQAQLKRAIEEITGDEAMEKAYLSAFEGDLAQLLPDEHRPLGRCLPRAGQRLLPAAGGAARL